MRTIIIGVSLALALLTGPASGEDEGWSTTQIMPGCRAFLNGGAPFKSGLCLGLVTGVGAGAVLQNGILKVSPPFCVPQDVTGSQLVLVVVKYIDQRPERMQEEFTLLALEALKAAWPCKPTEGKP